MSFTFPSRSLFCLPIALAASPLWAGDLLLYPDDLVSNKGAHSDQPLTVLAVEDQTGNDDAWSKYKEFYPQKKRRNKGQGYTGIFSYRLPTDADKQDVTAVELLTNYKGASRVEQRWTFEMRNFNTGNWVQIGDNQSAGDWVWSSMVFALPEEPTDFIDDAGQLSLRYVTKTSHDDSDLDYLALWLETQDEPPADEPPADEPPTGDIWRPAPGTSWQWQLTGNIDTSYDVDMYDIDLFDVPQSVIDALHGDGRIVICYFSAGSWENWRPDAGDFPDSIKGRSNGWPGEKWLDIRQFDESGLGAIMLARLDFAVEKGCDGVEPDNVDGYSNKTGFPLSYQNQLAYNAFLAEEAHARGLSVAMKNDLEQVEDLVTHFDFAIDEECFDYNECDLLQPFVNAGKAVLGVEYQGSPESFCPQANEMGMDFLKKHYDLDAWRIDCHDYQ